MEINRRPHHTRSGPVFVVGCARSGTSLTCRLLLDHLGVNFGTESQFIVRYYRKHPRYGSLRNPSSMRRLLNDISHERFFVRTRRNFGFVFDIDLAMRSIAEPTYAGAVRAIFEQFAATKGLVRWGDKTPEYSRHLDSLLTLFPNAQFLHVVRDPRDVAVSVFKTAFGAKHAYEAAVAWCDAVNRIEAFGKRLPPDQFMQFHYEALIESPADTLEGVARFLGIANHAQLVTGLSSHLRTQVRRDNSLKWKTSLSGQEIACIEAVTGPALTRFGYKPESEDGPSANVGFAQIARWQVQGMWRRAVNRRYWADNLYRLRLRFRDTPLMLRPSIRS
jgi:hypothetical protein